ncbi:MAG: type II toxin-antitoxin system Phd/YefM family antitoxin [Gammaproteobacteria bacterium]
MDREVGIFETKTHLSALLARVARGERFTITRRGKPVAELIPPAGGHDMSRHAEAVQTLDRVRGHLRDQGVHFAVSEIKGWVNEGRP